MEKALQIGNIFYCNKILIRFLTWNKIEDSRDIQNLGNPRNGSAALNGKWLKQIISFQFELGHFAMSLCLQNYK